GRTTQKRSHSHANCGFSAADVAHLDLARTGRRVDGALRAELGVAVAAYAPDLGQLGRDVLVARAGADQGAQIVAAHREEAGVELSLGRDPRAGAVAAERLRHGRDDPDLAPAVLVAPALGDLASIIRLDRLDRELGADQLDDLGGGDDLLGLPVVRLADRH